MRVVALELGVSCRIGSMAFLVESLKKRIEVIGRTSAALSASSIRDIIKRGNHIIQARFQQVYSLLHLFHRQEREANRLLREEQESAYKRSLEADRAKKATASSKVVQYVASIKRPPPPEPLSGTPLLKLSFQLPPGVNTSTRLMREFSSQDPTSSLYDFCLQHIDTSKPVHIRSLHPALVIPDSATTSLASLGIASNQKLLVDFE